MKLQKIRIRYKWFKKWLDDNYQKSSEKPFNNSDVKQYIDRGRLPSKYGGWNVDVLVKGKKEFKVRYIELKRYE